MNQLELQKPLDEEFKAIKSLDEITQLINTTNEKIEMIKPDIESVHISIESAKEVLNLVFQANKSCENDEKCKRLKVSYIIKYLLNLNPLIA